MTDTSPQPTEIIGGVDTHQDLHTAAIVSLDGAVLGTESFSTTRAGYRAMLRWFQSHGELLRVGVESTGTYGAGITRHLALAGVPVLEVTGPDPATRRAKGKDDALDAISAAEAARTRRRVQVAKDRSGAVEALRVLRTTRKTAVKCRRATLQQLHNTIVAAPEEVRDQVRNLTRMRRLRTCAAWRPDTVGYRDPAVATKLALKYLARRIFNLNDEIAELDRFIGPLVEELAPNLLQLEGVGTEIAGELVVAAGRESGPTALRGEFRDDVRGLPHPRVEREDSAPPPQSRRQPPSQLRLALGRHLPDAHRRANPSLCRAPHPARPVQTRSDTLPEALRGPRNLQSAHHPAGRIGPR